MTLNKWVKRARGKPRFQIIQCFYLKNMKPRRRRRIFLGFSALLLLIVMIFLLKGFGEKPQPIHDPIYTPPLVMSGGNSHVRALMRTISASESKDSTDPYTLLYGGQHFTDLSRHPDQCVRIISGPNKGNCSTAAGRYQLLTSTWEEKLQVYHSDATGTPDSFEPQAQDAIVYAWLTDHDAWQTDIPDLLEQGKLDQVFKLLSPTWTSLGYGIESNPTTPLLSQIYQKALVQEKASTKDSSTTSFKGD